jgi:HNH endonuclease
VPTGGEERAWSFLVIEEEKRQHLGNEGYDDRIGEYYSWDSTVPHHRRPAVGDVSVVRDSRGVLGISLIDSVEQTEGVEKFRRRCPECRRTGIKGRKTMTPRYRCGHRSCRAVFDEPIEERIEVTVYRAGYARSWRRVDGAVTADALETACVSHSKQQAIRPLDLHALRALLADRSLLIGRSWWREGTALEDREVPGGRKPRRSYGRIGQTEFRRRLLERFGPVCAFSGPQPPESLEAIHLTPFATSLRHDLAGGLLLRADLHSLFDRGLIGVDEDLKVRLDPSLRPYRELARLDGRELRVESSDPLLPELRAILKERKTVGAARSM